MRRFPTEGKDSDPQSPIQKLMDGASDIPFTLDAAPTASTALQILPKHGDVGHVAGVIYRNLNGSVYSFTGTLIA